MREKVVFLYIVSLVGVVLSFVLQEDAGRPDSTLMIIAVLGAVVLCSVAFLLSLIRRYIISGATVVLAFAVAFWAVGISAMPLLVAAALTVFAAMKIKWNFIVIWTVIIVLGYSLLLRPESTVLIISALLLGFSLYILWLMEKLAKSEQSAEGIANRAEEMREMIGSQRRVVKSTEQVSRLEERNRLAARIHDEIGHGMSGSILLLEGADMIMDKEPEKARETIKKVTENLRGSVEEIRKVLKEERSLGGEVSLARIENELAAFETDHQRIKTKLEAEGDMDRVNGAVWTCIYENMIEALTNLLKHSTATEFKVKLKNTGALLQVEFTDNGGSPKPKGDEPKGDGSYGSLNSRPVPVGMGLQNMEDRAALCYGRCFFRHESDGFHIVMTFPRRDSYKS